MRQDSIDAFIILSIPLRIVTGITEPRASVLRVAHKGATGVPMQRLQKT
jgi:hypothetical protein